MRPDRGTVVRMFTVILAACLLLPAGCIAVPTPSPLAPATTTLTPIPSMTPTEYPVLMCTAPACWEDEVYSCPEKCPGGCGTICATRTPDPNASPTPTFPPLSAVCVLPTPNPDQNGPRMAVCPSAYQLHLNGVIQIAAELTGLAFLDYVEITGQNVDGPGSFYLRARIGDHFPALNNDGAHLSLVMAQTHDGQIFIMLQAVSPGAVKINLRVIPTVPDVHSTLTLTVLP